MEDVRHVDYFSLKIICIQIEIESDRELNFILKGNNKCR